MFRQIWSALLAKATSRHSSCAVCGRQTVATLDGARFCSEQCAEADAWDQANG